LKLLQLPAFDLCVVDDLQFKLKSFLLLFCLVDFHLLKNVSQLVVRDAVAEQFFVQINLRVEVIQLVVEVGVFCSLLSGFDGIPDLGRQAPVLFISYEEVGIILVILIAHHEV